MAIYCEVMLHLWITESVDPGRLAIVIGFALGCGSLLGLISSHLPRKTHKVVAIAVSFVLVVLYMAEFILSETYQNFMTPQTMVAGAGGIAQDYLALTFKMIGRNLGRIFLLLTLIKIGLRLA